VAAARAHCEYSEYPCEISWRPFEYSRVPGVRTQSAASRRYDFEKDPEWPLRACTHRNRLVRPPAANMHVGAIGAFSRTSAPELDSGQVWLNNVLVDIYVELDQPPHPFFTGRHRTFEIHHARGAMGNVQHATCNEHSFRTRRQRAPCAACNAGQAARQQATCHCVLHVAFGVVYVALGAMYVRCGTGRSRRPRMG
jgi:hypothetical protein